jgi:hypothetical protein
VQFGARLAGALVLASVASAAFGQGMPPPGPGFSQPPQQSANPVCQRLEAQLASIERGPGGDQSRAEQARRYEEAAARQQGEIDRTVMQARRQGCESSGFFSLFSGQSAQCGPINNQLQQMRGNLDQIMRQLEQVRMAGGSAQENQRRSVLIALAQNNCGPQYAAAAGVQQQGGGFLGGLFGGGQQQQPVPPGAYPEYGAAGGTYRTMCVRTCDGYYFPISFATSPARFADDERACRAQCPASEATLYTFRNPGEDMNAAVSATTGQPYTALPAAFKYRQEFNPSCSCRAAGQSWADAMKNVEDPSLAQGDIVVTDERAKQMSQPPKGRPVSANPKGTPAPAPATATTTAPAQANGGTKQIRSVGPTFIQPKTN